MTLHAVYRSSLLKLRSDYWPQMRQQRSRVRLRFAAFDVRMPDQVQARLRPRRRNIEQSAVFVLARASMLFSTNSAIAFSGLLCDSAMMRIAFQSSPILSLPPSAFFARMAHLRIRDSAAVRLGRVRFSRRTACDRVRSVTTRARTRTRTTARHACAVADAGNSRVTG